MTDDLIYVTYHKHSHLIHELRYILYTSEITSNSQIKKNRVGERKRFLIKKKIYINDDLEKKNES